MKQSRRSFFSKSGKAVAAAGLATFVGNSAFGMTQTQKNLFVHHVYFWLKNPDSKEDKAKLIEGLQALSKVKTIKMFHIGQPAGTSRDVIDASYAISWLTLFEDKAGQDSYQVDPIHLDFVKNYAHLWSKVIVYDSVDV